MMGLCQWGCGRPATHFCTSCGKYICSHPACLWKSTRLGMKKLIQRKANHGS